MDKGYHIDSQDHPLTFADALELMGTAVFSSNEAVFVKQCKPSVDCGVCQGQGSVHPPPSLGCASFPTTDRCPMNTDIFLHFGHQDCNENDSAIDERNSRCICPEDLCSVVPTADAMDSDLSSNADETGTHSSILEPCHHFAERGCEDKDNAKKYNVSQKQTDCPAERQRLNLIDSFFKTKGALCENGFDSSRTIPGFWGNEPFEKKSDAGEDSLNSSHCVLVDDGLYDNNCEEFDRDSLEDCSDINHSRMEDDGDLCRINCFYVGSSEEVSINIELI